MPGEEKLGKYVKEVENIRRKAQELSLNDEEINGLFKECFAQLKSPKKEKSKLKKIVWNFLKVFFLFIIIILILYVIINVHQPTTSIVLRNVQGLIYPGLSLIRFLMVPIIKKYPSLTKLYDESCLVENPYFYLNDMECWPCQNVYSVIDLTDSNNHSMYHSGIPYIIKTNQSLITYEKLMETYLNNKEIFDKDADRIKSSNNSLTQIKDLVEFNLKESSETHISWRINRMTPIQLIRKLFPRPYIISEWSGQSMERYVMINGPKSFPYQLPNFECSYVFVIQGFGEQTIILKPTQECFGECRTISVILKPSYVLWYNWWYWRPISLPTRNATGISISYINSYC
ncbi:uncharacterized protein [Onthophagus taurus]|uniref:uncharacterized protein n=1 Tax=Onthophagus taurus TaxID=166361 RepID=UPI0039BDB48F